MLDTTEEKVLEMYCQEQPGSDLWGLDDLVSLALCICDSNSLYNAVHFQLHLAFLRGIVVVQRTHYICGTITDDL